MLLTLLTNWQTVQLFMPQPSIQTMNYGKNTAHQQGKISRPSKTLKWSEYVHCF